MEQQPHDDAAHRVTPVTTLEQDVAADQIQSSAGSQDRFKDEARKIASGDGSIGSALNQLKGNTALLYAGGAYAAAFLTLRARSVFSFIRRQLLVDLEIQRTDPSYHWFLRWMTAHQRAQHSGEPLFASAGKDVAATSEPTGVSGYLMRKIKPRVHHLAVQTVASDKPEESRFAHFSLVPGPGKHLIRFRNAFVLINRERQRTMDLQAGGMFETVKMTTLYSHRHIFEAILAEAHRLTVLAHENKTMIFIPRSMDWEPFGEPKLLRPMESVVLEPKVKDRVVHDIAHFLQSKEWYLTTGIPYRRTYLLHGHPGTGKSSFVRALAGYFGFNIAILHLSQKGLTDDRLNSLINIKLPARTIVLIEDADCAFTNRSETDEYGYAGSSVTFAGLLNALDGVASAEDRIVFMTTNHPEKLDPAFIRPGRVDIMERIGLASEWQLGRMWDLHYATFDPAAEAKGRFLEACRVLGKCGRVSTAAVQGLFLQHQGDVEGAVASVGDLGRSEVMFRDGK